MAFSGQLLAVTNPSLGGVFWPTLGCHKSYCRVLVTLSGQLLAVSNRTAESWWLFLANSWPYQIVLPSLGGSFWPTFGSNKSYCRVSVALSVGRNKSYCRVLVALSGPHLAVTHRTAKSRWLFLLAVTNRTAESWWLFLANSWP